MQDVVLPLLLCVSCDGLQLPVTLQKSKYDGWMDGWVRVRETILYSTKSLSPSFYYFAFIHPRKKINRIKKKNWTEHEFVRSNYNFFDDNVKSTFNVLDNLITMNLFFLLKITKKS